MESDHAEFGSISGGRMPKQGLDWDKMFAKLKTFHHRFKHTNVRANWKENPQLGRWVAMIRYRRKVDGLPADKIAKLDDLGFIWCPADEAWEKMFGKLAAYKKKYGHCNVPAQWKANLHLANWVANQRHRKKMGSLPPERVRRMDQIGFEWAIYGQAKARPSVVIAVRGLRRTANMPEERLYCVNRGEYLQYNGVDAMPAELKKYVEAHKGELPPYIPLPDFTTRFHLGENPVRGRKVAWAGKGRLPRVILDYVCENGVLPPHD
jgi:hypothetical protein